MRLVLRVVLVLGLLAWMWGGPFARQVLHAKNHALPQWVMFSGASTDVCEVEFRTEVDGETRVLDRWEVLGEARWQQPLSRRLVRGEGDARRAARELCRALGPGAEVHAKLRCATRRGWTRVFDGSEVLCAL